MYTKEELLKRRKKLSDRQKALLKQRLKTAQEAPPPQEVVAEAGSLPTVVAAPEQRYEPFPLTDVQGAYWIGRQDIFELGNVATHNYNEFESQGLKLAQLEWAWQRLIERHDMLRAVIRDDQQQILKEVPPYQIKVLDLRGQDKMRQTLSLEATREEMSHQILPLEEWPPFDIRATLLDNDIIRLHISFDLVMGDAWSTFLILKEWGQLYQAPSTILPPLTLSFRDYVLSEKRLEDGPSYQRSSSYWLGRTLPPAPELPLAKNPASIREPHFKRRRRLIERETWEQLKHKTAKAGLTPSGLLLAAFAEVLSKWCKSPRFTINLTLFNRPPVHPQINQIVGDFTSLTLLEVDFSAAEPFKDKARRVQQQLWQDLEHRSFSGVRVLRELARQQNHAGQALMPIIFTSTLALGGAVSDSTMFNLLGEEVYGITQTSQVWLDHQVLEQDGALILNWDGVEGLFPEGLLDDIFAAYHNFVKELATSEQAWQETSRKLVPDYQLAQRATVNATQAPISDELLHTLFIKQVERYADNPAVISSEFELTYQELYTISNQIGHQLRQWGAQPNKFVAVVMEKGWEQVVAVLAILMSGAAYLPIDANLPTERQWYLLEQGEVQIVLTQSKLEHRLAWPDGLQRLSVDEQRSSVSHSTAAPLEVRQTPEDLAYVIYTSGSTGLPKGVAIDHRGALNTVLDINQRFDVTDKDRVLALSALNFDLSVYDIFGLLAVGGTIIMPEPALVREPSHWVELMEEQQVTLWDTVPALMQMLVEYLTGRTIDAPLDLVMMSGDWIPVNLPDQIKSLWPEAKVMSLGGATEASIWSIYYPILEVSPDWTSIPYGKPMTNQSFHVLNQLMEPCPVWVPGQLYIGGIGLAKEYWQNEEKTNASFIINPHTGQRLYKTGDLGRYLPDGNIEFLGREDFQVKIRGHRIELGEIEANLLTHPIVKEAIVTTVGEERTNKQLVAYIVPNESSQPTESIGRVPSEGEDVLHDPIERIEFKVKQMGVQEPSEIQIQLSGPDFDDNLTETYRERRSHRQFLPQAISQQQLAHLLSTLRQMKLPDAPLPKYRYPSAGSLYPVQSYLYIKANRVAGLAGGLYYYNPARHTLYLVGQEVEKIEQLYGDNQPIMEQSAFALFLIGQLKAIAPMYGQLARDFCLLEAGHIGQLLMTHAPEEQIGLCPIGSLYFDPLRDAFGLDSSQILLYSFLGGGIDPTLAAAPPQEMSSEQLAEQQLRQYLEEKLPAYMVPALYVFLDTFPLTPNGKVNRKALPAPTVLLSEQHIVEPGTELEKELANIWQTVLGASASIHDNFFEMGGDSVLAIQAISRLREAFQMELPLRQLFENPTIASLAEHIETLKTVQNILDYDSAEEYEEGEL